MSALRALGGGELLGDKLVRFAYMDESGTGGSPREPLIMMGGIVLHADRDWMAIEQYIRDMADDFARPEDRVGFAFHAQELMKGGKRIPRDKYPEEKCRAFLQALCEIPQRFGLLVVFASQPREASTSLEHSLMALSGVCAMQVDEFVERNCDPGEVATMVYEENGKYGKFIREHQEFLRSEHMDALIRQEPGTQLRRISRVIEQAMFVSKRHPAMQVADACLYVLGRRMRRCPSEERFYKPLMSQLMRVPSALFSDLPPSAFEGLTLAARPPEPRHP